MTDLERSVAWYRDVLGLNFLFAVPGQSMAFFQCGETRIYLGVPESEEFGSRPIVYYNVGEIERAVTEIEARGGRFDGEPHVVHRDEGSELWLASLSDPDGVPVVLMETRAR